MYPSGQEGDLVQEGRSSSMAIEATTAIYVTRDSETVAVRWTRVQSVCGLVEYRIDCPSAPPAPPLMNVHLNSITG